MKQRIFRNVALALVLAGVQASALGVRADVAPAAREMIEAMSAKLGAATTIQVKAKHALDPLLGLDAAIDRGPIHITVQRPNRFYAIQPAGRETREIAYDGETLCVMHPGMQHHALEALAAASVEAFSDQMDERFGFRPPVAELLANDAATEMLRNVTTARVVGKERVGWTRCHRLQLEQEGTTIDLWVGLKDKLPRRMLVIVTDHPARPTWNIRFSGWDLNAKVDAGLFGKRPAAESVKVEMIRNR
ncbi:MAG: DUF2092 domain-containing protein [Verrucomicrobia bacterium]|nr:DUF2092 domain-containing protein [Verrucomicrobiota bacterium]